MLNLRTVFLAAGLCLAVRDACRTGRRPDDHHLRKHEQPVPRLPGRRQAAGSGCSRTSPRRDASTAAPGASTGTACGWTADAAGASW